MTKLGDDIKEELNRLRSLIDDLRGLHATYAYLAAKSQPGSVVREAYGLAALQLADTLSRNGVSVLSTAEAVREVQAHMDAKEGRCPNCGGPKEDRAAKICGPCRLSEYAEEIGLTP